jgi:hypothetical protein
MTPSRPKVAVCFPSGDMVHADFALALAGLCLTTREAEVVVLNTKSSIVAEARNSGVALAQEKGADHLLFLDSDMAFPADALQRLLGFGRDVIGATYPKRVPPHEVLGTMVEGAPAEPETGLIPMQRLPTGCLLIRMSVFEALKRPYFRFTYDEVSGRLTGEDYDFSDRAIAAGFRLWCDAALSFELGHIGQRVYRAADSLPKAGPASATSKG